MVDEQFSILSRIVNHDRIFYSVPFLGKIDAGSSWEACFLILLVAYESVFVWSLWIAIKGRIVDT